MKKSVDMLGLPIISITEGTEVGVSKSLLLDAKNATVAALIIEDENWYRGGKILPYDSVNAIGNDAITIMSSETILQLGDATTYEPLLEANINVINTKAITKSGFIKGIVREIVIGDNGHIEKCELETSEGDIHEIPSDQISVFGKQVTIIDDECDIPSTDNDTKKKITPAETTPAAPAPTPVAPAAPAAPTATAPAAPAHPQPVVQATAPAQVPTPAAAAPAASKPQIDHSRFLLGKKVSRKIATDGGIVIADIGTTVTEEILQKARLANKFVELSMNVQ